ncbi:MAG: hypothetical protein HC853_16330 [Anaerolineae bacterium]|nr:hypothetical protein [Anaerolineae bacterium]
MKVLEIEYDGVTLAHQLSGTYKGVRVNRPIQLNAHADIKLLLEMADRVLEGEEIGVMLEEQPAESMRLVGYSK